jgi:hypothetical protein
MARVRNSRARDSSWKTPNRIACDPEEGETAIVKLLIAAGAASNSASSLGAVVSGLFR